MPDILTQAELDAILAYPDKLVQKIPQGTSGLYDEFGILMTPTNAKTRERLAIMRKLVIQRIGRVEIANVLHMSLGAFDQMVNRWGGLGEK